MPNTVTVRSGRVGSTGTIYSTATYQPRPGIPSQFTRRDSHVSADSYSTCKPLTRPPTPTVPLSPRPATPSPPRGPVSDRNASIASVYSFPTGTPLAQNSPPKVTEQADPIPSVPKHYRAKKMAVRVLQPVLGAKLTGKLFPPLRDLIDRA